LGDGKYGIRGSAPGIIISMMTPPTGAPQAHFVSTISDTFDTSIVS